jgi:hypothetical protein
MALRGSGRWLHGLRAAYSIDVAERHFRAFEQAHSAERESVLAGSPVAASVDAWFIPSPYERREHIAHCVIVTEISAREVWAADPMNHPEPTAYSIQEWAEMRAAPATGGLRTFFVASAPRVRPSVSALLGQLRDDISAHQDADESALAAYLDFCGRQDGGVIDVSEVAAERLYLAKFLKHASGKVPALVPAADRLLALARRWYLAHSVARESAGTRPGHGSRAREVRLLRELADREAQDRRLLAAQLGTGARLRLADV